MDIAQTQDEAVTEASLTLCIIYIYEIIIALLLKSLDLWDTTYKEIQPVHSKGDQPWMFFGRNDAKAETPVLWPHLMRRVDSLEKTLMLGGIGGRRKRG